MSEFRISYDLRCRCDDCLLPIHGMGYLAEDGKAYHLACVPEQMPPRPAEESRELEFAL